MGTVIYSVSPFQAYIGSLGPMIFIFAIGLVGIGISIFRRNQSRGTRILAGILGGFLLIVSIVAAAISITSLSSNTKMVALKLDNKRIVEDNCGDNGETCTRYVLESTTNTEAYDFTVSQDAYEKAQIDTCYDFTYYPNTGLFSSGGDSYKVIEHISLIETADPNSCQ